MIFRENPRLREQLTNSPAGRGALAEIARKEIAPRATEIGQQVSSTYGARAFIEGPTVRVRARTFVLDAAAWIEFGTARLPAAAPLRKAVRQAGLELR